MAKDKKEKTTEKQTKEIDQIQEYLNANEAFHFNSAPPVDYTVSSGSLILDIELGGGLKPGCSRFIGAREAGKTSCALLVGKLFQETVPNSMLIYIKAEGRLSDNIKERSGLDFSPEKFRIIKSNVFEFIINLMRDLVKNNEYNKRYMFIIDSLDALQTKAQAELTVEENLQPGVIAKMSSTMFKSISLAFSELGHCGIIISQERSVIDINPYTPKAQRLGNSGGGNAAQHFIDVCLNFKAKNKSSLIYEGDDNKSKILGHNCVVEFLKTTNEKTFTLCSFPIKYGQKGGSVWKEREVVSLLLMFEHAKPLKKGFILDENSSLIKEIKEKFPEKYQSEFTFGKNFYQYFEDNKDISDYLWNRFKEVIIK